MSFSLHINVPVLQGLLRRAATAAAPKVAKALQREIYSLVDAELNTSRNAYKHSLVVTSQGTTVTATIHNPLAIAIEEGAPSFDIKKMLKGRPYVDVPLDLASGLKFRRMSQRSKGWIHPGWKARNIMRRAANKVQGRAFVTLMTSALQSFLRGGP